VAAVLDWEMCTIGDPLLDLGRVIAAWPTAGEPMAAAGPIYAAAGLPTARELAERYARRSARPLDALNWYVVLACFKLGIVLEGTFARAFAGQADERVGDRLHATTVALFERANTLIHEPGAAAALL
jgi:aminoglycoside phosphotransferase (APT) family kinase protein